MKFKGDGINIGKGKKIKIKQINNPKHTETPLRIERNLITDLNIKPSKLSLFSGLTFGATFITYLGLLIKFPIIEIPSYAPNLSILIIAISTLGLFVGLTLTRKKFLTLWRNYSLESNGNQISWMKNIIECPICKSNMNMNSLDGNTFVICTRNPSHKYDFDYTKFDNIK